MGKVNKAGALDLIDRVVSGEDAGVVVAGVCEGREEGVKEEKDDLRERAERFLSGRKNRKKKGE